jgi:Holliday junction resolvase YEN1
MQVSRWQGGNVSDHASKKLISLLRFPCHVAPGEAEAECAMLQKHGIVDAVMTQDVDAIVFGSGLTLRDWSKEGKMKGNQTPTHVSIFDLEKLKEVSRGLDPDGMILVALLSGGDYDGDGVAGIGIALACEIARAGFGSDLLELVRNENEDGIAEWRERLQYELESNESGYFKMKRKVIKIPEDFPNRRILGYYMNPAVTEEGELKNLEKKWAKVWAEAIEVQALRDYARDTLDWQYKPGAWKFVRVMAPALLADRLRRDAATSIVTSVDQITERRQHFVSDGIPELRVTVIPAEVVGLDLDAEDDSPEYLDRLAAQEENEAAGEESEFGPDEALPASQGPIEKRRTSPWLPWNPEKMWLAEAIVELGAREHVERWNQMQWEIQNDPKKFATRKCPKKKKEPQKLQKSGGMKAGAIHSYITAAKSTSKSFESLQPCSDAGPKTMSDPVTVVDASLPLPPPPAKAIITDRFAVVDESFSPSPPPPRLKANTKTRRGTSTPTKKTPIRHEQSTSPLMQDYFKSTKSSQVEPTSQGLEPSQSSPLTKLNRVDHSKDEDPFISHEAHNGKHSRPSTSSSMDIVLRITKKSSKPRAKNALPVVQGASLSSSSHHRGETVSDAGLVQPAIHQAATAENSDLGDNLTNVTRRTPRRRTKKAQVLPDIQTLSPETVRPRRRIESFFKPYLKPMNREEPMTIEASTKDREKQLVFPLDPTTDLSPTSSEASHIHAIPRSSLPGTWKEVECESAPSSRTGPPGASRRPRVSIVDLTAA